MLLDAAAKLHVLLFATTSEGKRFRRAQELRLERAHLPAFPLTWTLMHVLDEQSPLHGYDTERAIAARAQLFVTREARDPTLAALVQLCAGRYTIRDALCGRLILCRGRHACRGPHQDRSSGAGHGRSSGTGLDGAGRSAGVDAAVLFAIVRA